MAAPLEVLQAPSLPSAVIYVQQQIYLHWNCIVGFLWALFVV